LAERGGDCYRRSSSLIQEIAFSTNLLFRLPLVTKGWPYYFDRDPLLINFGDSYLAVIYVSLELLFPEAFKKCDDNAKEQVWRSGPAGVVC